MQPLEKPEIEFNYKTEFQNYYWVFIFIKLLIIGLVILCSLTNYFGYLLDNFLHKINYILRLKFQ